MKIGYIISVNNCDNSAIRPILKFEKNYKHLINKSKYNKNNNTYEVEFGEYPQWEPEEAIQKELEEQYQKGSLKQLNIYEFLC